MDRSMTPAGYLHLGAARPTPAQRPTVVVAGPPRSGTSLVAAALQGAGLWMGDHVDPAFGEDMALAGVLDSRLPWRRRQYRHAFRGNRGLALRGFDVAAFEALVAERNERHAAWGFKRPNASAILGASGMAMLRDPRAIVLVRDPLAAGERTAIAEGLDLDVSLERATRGMVTAVRAARRLGVPTMLISYERLRADESAVLSEALAFAGVDPARLNLEQVRAAGADYLRQSSGPPAGHLDWWGDGVLRGWARQPGVDEPVEVLVVVDGDVVARVRADEHRADLQRAGFGQGRHGFQAEVALPATGPGVVTGIVVETGVALEGSGSRLTDLRG